MQPSSVRGRRTLITVGILLLLTLFGYTIHYAAPQSPLLAPSLHHTDHDVGILEDVLNRTLGFQKIYAINLPYRTDHRDAMSLAAVLTDLDIEYIDGVTDVHEKARPPMGAGVDLDEPTLRALRAHVNTLRLIVENNITTALILEDDADWDIRIKEQMQSFAKASSLLLQPLQGTTDQFVDPSYPQPASNERPQNFEIGSHAIERPSTSPYGDIDRWDVLWIGHCGCRFPEANDGNTPLGRVVILNDTTVPEKQHIQMQFGNNDLTNEYPNHTRVVSRARVNTCSLAYAVSQSSARRLLYEMGLNVINGPTDLTLRSICEGSEGRRSRVCLTVQPQLFQHHRTKGAKSSYSDVSSDHTGYNEQAFTRNVRWSTRLNFAKLLDGETDYIDLFRDGEKPLNLGF
ncbi:hypothetical protein EJ05DRAFT_511985 [Pseudovirgaria hyperparasitica]|uniref:Glycosyltransferase family 25 protein n=1 Tax=Pseudovirgaria hyperparasitica TaxID=470096 RepID=A0A6A6W2R2_9PEZI|nr:uncharacterized protein EJ05DRAFT_511985 [Pseudovirgaria hyperparasitica]KAF2756304.1 hypothetical protein EJ05DRAFT_511985 [Pseudovirgaria hyperparasitica]